MGRALVLLCLGIRPPGARGCPVTESGTTWECLTTQPAAVRRPAQGHTRVSRTWSLRRRLCPGQNVPRDTVILKRGVVQLQAVSRTRKEVSHRYLRRAPHRLFRGRPPRPRRASVCPLDTGALRGVRRVHFECCSLSAWSLASAASILLKVVTGTETLSLHSFRVRISCSMTFAVRATRYFSPHC